MIFIQAGIFVEEPSGFKVKYYFVLFVKLFRQEIQPVNHFYF